MKVFINGLLEKIFGDKSKGKINYLHQTKNTIMINGEEYSTKDMERVEIVVTGDVDVLNISCAKTVVINGNVKKIKSSSGKYEVNGNVEGKIKSTSGSIDINGDVTGDVESISGNIKIKTTHNANIKTVSGSVVVDFAKGVTNL